MKRTSLVVGISLMILASSLSFADTEVTYTGTTPDASSGSYNTGVTPPAPPEDTYTTTTTSVTPPAPPEDTYTTTTVVTPPAPTENIYTNFNYGYGIDDVQTVYITDQPYTYEIIRSGRHHHHRSPLRWVNSVKGAPLPFGAVIGGNQSKRPYNFYICRGEYRNGVHPGKLVGGDCVIGWGGDEVLLSRYQVLVSKVALNWVPASYGRVPINSIAGGFQPDGTLYICRARFHGGYHPGKLVGQNCNFGYNGEEVTLPRYQVLTM